MKLLHGPFSFLLFLLLFVELHVLSMSRPTPMRLDEGLKKQMTHLLNLVRGVLSNFEDEQPSEQNLPSLPVINFRPQDLATVKVNTTLSQLSSGLHTFKLHFDWLLHWQNQSGLTSHETKEIANHIQNMLVQRQMFEWPHQNRTLSIPPPTSAWAIDQTKILVHRQLQKFCDWYIRALRTLLANNRKKNRKQ